jgi:hypothetical protein
MSKKEKEKYITLKNNQGKEKKLLILDIQDQGDGFIYFSCLESNNEISHYRIKKEPIKENEYDKGSTKV